MDVFTVSTFCSSPFLIRSSFISHYCLALLRYFWPYRLYSRWTLLYLVLLLTAKPVSEFVCPLWRYPYLHAAIVSPLFSMLFWTLVSPSVVTLDAVLLLLPPPLLLLIVTEKENEIERFTVIRITQWRRSAISVLYAEATAAKDPHDHEPFSVMRMTMMP